MGWWSRCGIELAALTLARQNARETWGVCYAPPTRRTGRWASVMPAKLAEVLGLTEKVRAIPIVEPEVAHSIGLVVPYRNPLTPLINALVAEAKQLAPILSSDTPPERVRSKRDAKSANPLKAHAVRNDLES